MVGIYLGIYDGTSAIQNIEWTQTDKELPLPAVQFGQYNLTGIAKKDEIHFFTVTTNSNWSLDFFGL